MSNALVIVSFEDGEKLYTQYQGSADVFYSALFESEEDAWSLDRHDPKDFQSLTRYTKLKNPEKVHVFNDYGAGSDGYDAYACRKTKQLRVYHDWLDLEEHDLDTWRKMILEESQKE